MNRSRYVSVDTMNLLIHGNILVVREMTRDTCKNRFFVKIDQSRAAHISSMISRRPCSLNITRGQVEYSIQLTNPRDSLELIEVANCDYPNLKGYLVRDNTLEAVDEPVKDLIFTTGSASIDSLVDEITSFRDTWARLMFGLSTPRTLYKLFLIAETSFNYHLARRLKETWLEFSSEYLGFLLSIIHQVLLHNGYELANPSAISDKCRDVYFDNKISWRDTSLIYRKGEDQVNVILDKMIHGVSPDIVISTRRSWIVLESKQGPVSTWLTKAIKQSKRYRELFKGRIVLVTNRALSNDQYRTLVDHYDVVIQQCNVANIDMCRNIFAYMIVSVINS